MTWNWLGKGRRGPPPSLTPSPPPLETLGDVALERRISSIRNAVAEGRLSDASLEAEQLWRSNPDSEEALTLRGICSYLEGDIGAATSFLGAAAERNPKNAEAFKFLAACLESQRDDTKAVSINTVAVELNPADAQVLCVAAALHTRLGNFDDAARLLNQALKVSPDSLLAINGFEVLSSRSTYKRALYEVGPKPAEARTRAERRLLAEHRKNGLSAESLAMLLRFLAADKASFPRALKLALASIEFEPMTAALAEQIASVFWLASNADQMLALRVLANNLDGNDPTARLALSHARLMTGHSDWLGTWRVMTDALIKSHPEVHPQQIPTWSGQRLGRGKLLVYQDQGVGDAIMALRFVALLAARGIEFDLWVVPSLARLARNVVGPTRVLEAPLLPDGTSSDYAYAVPLFGLISALEIDRAELAAVAPFEIDAGHAPHLRAMVRENTQRKKIGLIWGGNPMRRDDWLRHVPVELLLPLARVNDIGWVNLTNDARPEKAELIERFAMCDPMPLVTDFYDTAAVISELDGVVAIDSSVAHIAAALGKPLWVLAPTMLDWRWQMGNTMSPWWPAAKVLRADVEFGFKSAVHQIVEQLDKFAK